MNCTDLFSYIHSLGLTEAGIAPPILPLPGPAYTASPLCPLAAGSGAERYEPQRLLPSCQSILVILFPYYINGVEKSNISRYCRSLDYHLIVRDYLVRIEAFLHAHEECETKCIIDTSPLDDRWLAYEAGLGFFGDNHCLINHRYGSYCFIGSILTSLPLPPHTPLAEECCHCGRCAAACPGRCFQGGIYDYRRCKSFLTQKKGSLLLPEIEVMQKTKLIFGCDVCQDVCPHNAHIDATPLPEFQQNRLLCLQEKDIEGLSNRQFQQAYGDRAFAWRGKKQLLRNLSYLQSRNPGYDGDGNIDEKEDNTACHDNNR